MYVDCQRFACPCQQDLESPSFMVFYLRYLITLPLLLFYILLVTSSPNDDMYHHRQWRGENSLAARVQDCPTFSHVLGGASNARPMSSAVQSIPRGRCTWHDPFDKYVPFWSAWCVTGLTSIMMMALSLQSNTLLASYACVGTMDSYLMLSMKTLAI